MSFRDWLAYRKLGSPKPGRIEQHPKGTFTFEDGAEFTERVTCAFGDPARLSVMDLGSGPGQTVIAKQILAAPWRRLVSVEAFLPYVNQLRQNIARAARHDIHEVHIEEVFEEVGRGEIDVAFLIDVLEHFDRADALRLLVRLETFVNKGIVIFSPLGVVPQEDLDGNALQRHRSTWQAAELAHLGYDVEVYEAFHGHLTPAATAAWAIRSKVKSTSL